MYVCVSVCVCVCVWTSVVSVCNLVVYLQRLWLHFDDFMLPWWCFWRELLIWRMSWRSTLCLSSYVCMCSFVCVCVCVCINKMHRKHLVSHTFIWQCSRIWKSLMFLTPWSISHNKSKTDMKIVCEQGRYGSASKVITVRTDTLMLWKYSTAIYTDAVLWAVVTVLMYGSVRMMMMIWRCFWQKRTALMLTFWKKRFMQLRGSKKKEVSEYNSHRVVHDSVFQTHLVLGGWTAFCK